LYPEFAINSSQSDIDADNAPEQEQDEAQAKEDGATSTEYD
jgi:hypothetical protein